MNLLNESGVMATNQQSIINDFNIEITDENWQTTESFILKTAQEVVKTLSPVVDSDFSYSINICLTNNQEVQELNRDYRSKDKPTNVLTFEYEPDEFDMLEDELQLGDIFIARETVEQEAKDQGKTFEAHLTHLTIHGILHSFGFDHITDSDAELMEDLEVRILKNLGYNTPYETK